VDGIFSKKSRCQLSVFVQPSHKTATICCIGDGLMMGPSMRRLRLRRVARSLLIARAPFCDARIQLLFWRSLDSSQPIPASRMRSTIAIAVRHRSNSCFCCALKSSSGFAGLRIILDGITHSSAVRRERGRVSQPLTPRVKSVMPNTSTSTCVDSVFDSRWITAIR